MRAVFDVNVLVSGFPTSRTPPADLIDGWQAAEFESIVSEHILNGISRAWNKPYYRSRYTSDQAQQTLAVLRVEASIVVPTDTVHGVGEDEEDDLVLATAVAGRVPYLVTGDHGLLRLDAYEGIQILSPREFLTLLDQESSFGA